MTERTLAERLREHLILPPPNRSAIDNVALLRETLAALERLEALEGFLDREGIRRGSIDHGLPTPTLVDRVEAYGHECADRAVRATPAPAPQQGGPDGR